MSQPYHSVPAEVLDPLPQPYPGAVLQSEHDVAPSRLYFPAGQIADAGVGVVDPGGHAYPAEQGVHDVAPDRL